MAFMESIAKERQRNVEWALSAVREAEAIAQDEALELGVIDLIATNRADLLEKLEGMEISIGGEMRVLAVADAEVRVIEMTAMTRLFNFLASPDVAVLLVMAGMFGLGAGLANVPVLNLMMGAPLKVSVATSKFLLSVTDTSAAWIYVNNGAVIPMIVVPSIIGIMLGSMVGVRILTKVKPASVRYIVIVMLLFAGSRALLKGLGIWE